jgi:competence protein ComGC
LNLYDLNRDGRIDNNDAVILENVIAHRQSCPSGKTCDFNNDGVVNRDDLIVLTNYIEYLRMENVAANIVVSPTTGLVTTESGGSASFNVVLSSQPIANVAIALRSSNTREGRVSPATLIFTPSNWNIPQTVTVTGVDDTVVDGDQTYTIITDPAVSSDARYNGINPADVQVINRDNDSPVPPTPAPVRFDLNDDRIVDGRDVDILRQVIFGFITCPSRKNCDFNNSGSVEVGDLVTLINYLLNLYDLNRDGRIDNNDAVILENVIAHRQSCPSGKTCDFNNDGVVNRDDLIVLTNYYIDSLR